MSGRTRWHCLENSLRKSLSTHRKMAYAMSGCRFQSNKTDTVKNPFAYSYGCSFVSVPSYHPQVKYHFITGVCTRHNITTRKSTRIRINKKFLDYMQEVACTGTDLSINVDSGVRESQQQHLNNCMEQSAS